MSCMRTKVKTIQRYSVVTSIVLFLYCTLTSCATISQPNDYLIMQEWDSCHDVGIDIHSDPKTTFVLSYILLKKIDKFDRLLRDCVEKGQSNDLIIAQYLKSLSYAKNPDLALKEVKTLERLVDEGKFDSRSSQLLVAYSLNALGYYAEAISHYEKYKDNSSQDIYIDAHIAQLYILIHRLDLADELLHHILYKNPEYSYAKLLSAIVSMLNGDFIESNNIIKMNNFSKDLEDCSHVIMISNYISMGDYNNRNQLIDKYFSGLTDSERDDVRRFVLNKGDNKSVKENEFIAILCGCGSIFRG